MKKILFCIIIVWSALTFSCSNYGLKTPLEESRYNQLSTNQQILEFLDQVSEKSSYIDYLIIDTTLQGRYIPMVRLSKNDNTVKPAILFIAQQHGNEPSGKEGMLLLIKDFASGKYSNWLNNVDIFILPQVNPDGGDLNQRRTSDQIDLNRDHLLLKSREAKAVQDIFDELKPAITVDFHEYYPYSKSWEEFGYRRDFDIQFGGLTNININNDLQNYFYKTFYPEVKQKVEQKGYSFFEYTLGNFSRGERLRHSTVDINDGRQSFGICNTMSFIVEGKNGRDSIFEIQRRANSQYLTAKSILESSVKNIDEINELVNAARKDNLEQKNGEKVSIRMDHFKGDIMLNYPLKAVNEEKDSVFVVDEFHDQVKTMLDVTVPKMYLIPKSDSLLTQWLKRSNFEFFDYNKNEDDKIFGYKILNLHRSIDEELENYYPEVSAQKIEIDLLNDQFFAVPTNQFYKYKIVTALEPQAMYGIANYPDFEYLLFDNYFKIYRVEY
ncbi:MAG: M14 family zinc carboxypeptidase [Bacteroidales bacterium]